MAYCYVVSLATVIRVLKPEGEIYTLSSTILEELGVLPEFDIYAVGYIF